MDGTYNPPLEYATQDITHSGAAGTEEILIRPPAGQKWFVTGLTTYNTEGGLAVIPYLTDGTISMPMAASESPAVNEVMLLISWGLTEEKETSGHPIMIDYNNYIKILHFSVADSKHVHATYMYEIHPAR